MHGGLGEPTLRIVIAVGWAPRAHQNADQPIHGAQGKSRRAVGVSKLHRISWACASALFYRCPWSRGHHNPGNRAGTRRHSDPHFGV